VRGNPTRPPFEGRLVIVGGQCRKVGKTALIVDLIRALRGLPWTAVKVTPHTERGCPVHGPSCGCSADQHTFRIRDEQDATGTRDTSRFLEAGARRAIWVETKEGRLADALVTLASELAQADPTVIESNAIVEFWRPDLFLMVLDSQKLDFKQSAREALDHADAFVFRSPVREGELSAVRLSAMPQKQIFVQLLGQPLPLGVQAMARERIRRPLPSP
jgi:molybdopterin-guanine dinucleotide biosynthesis protein